MKEQKPQDLYQKYSCDRHWEKHPTTYAEFFAEFLKERDFNGLIVDVGCGSGRDVDVFSRFGFNSMGIDNSEREIKLARKRFPESKFNVQDAENLEFEDSSVDAFFMINVIHFLEKERAIQNLSKILKSHGYLFIHFNINITDKNGNIDYHHGQDDILRLVSKFKIVHKKIFERADRQPIEHKHEIMELILQKH